MTFLHPTNILKDRGKQNISIIGQKQPLSFKLFGNMKEKIEVRLMTAFFPNRLNERFMKMFISGERWMLGRIEIVSKRTPRLMLGGPWGGIFPI